MVWWKFSFLTDRDKASLLKAVELARSENIQRAGCAASGRACPELSRRRHGTPQNQFRSKTKIRSGRVSGCPGVRGPGVRRPRQRDNARQGVDQLTDVLNEVPRNSDFVTMTKFSNEPFSYLRLLAWYNRLRKIWSQWQNEKNRRAIVFKLGSY